MKRAWWVILPAVIFGVSALGQGSAAPLAAPAALNGRKLYRSYCAPCHGPSGKGDGPDAAIFAARPRDLRAGFLKLYKTEDLARRVREGKPLELALDLPMLRARGAEVEAVAAHLKRLPTIDWEQVTQGQDLFVDRCALCHGAYGHAGPAHPAGVQVPRDLSDPGFQKTVPDDELLTALRHGRQGMPGLTPRVTQDDARLLLAFVRILSPGFESYSQYCASCHNDDGHGSGSLAEGIRQPAVVFDRAYFARRDADELRGAVWHMLTEEKPTMPHYRTLLTKAQARAIIAYLKRIQ